MSRLLSCSSQILTKNKFRMFTIFYASHQFQRLSFAYFRQKNLTEYKICENSEFVKTCGEHVDSVYNAIHGGLRLDGG